MSLGILHITCNCVRIEHRTARLSEALGLILLINKKLKGKKNGKSSLNLNLSHQVAPAIQLSNQLKERFRNLYELRAFIPVVELKPMRLKSEAFRAVS